MSTSTSLNPKLYSLASASICWSCSDRYELASRSAPVLVFREVRPQQQQALVGFVVLPRQGLLVDYRF